MSQDRHAVHGGDARVGDPLIGRLLDRRYRISGRIARGGMASVYEATDIRLDRTVAVKVMHAGLGHHDDGDSDFAARFVREARAAARLSHPNVVAVYDQGEEDGTVFLVMELISGHTLRDTIAKESPMPAARALALMEPVLSALASAHRAGLIHRDVKPENVLISTEPHSGASRIKVADFGLAKAVSADTQHTATKGVLIGTVSYLAPELVVEGRADARADVYAAGVLLYELLTGSKPHEGETPIQVAYKHVHHDVPPPSRLVPELPAYVDALVARATARDRSLRPADAAVLLHQVHRVSQALADGVRDDPELTQDLTPLMMFGVGTDTGSETAKDMWDPDEMATLLAPSAAAPVREHTTTYPAAKPPPPRPPDPARTTRTPRTAQPPKPPRQRRSKRGPALLVLALVLVLVAGVGAYWFGWARYTSTPGVIGLTQIEAEQRLEAAGLSVDYAEEAYSEAVPAGAVIETDPTAGSRVLQEGTVTVTVSLGQERYDVPALRGKTEDQAQDALLELKLDYDETVERFSEKALEGTVLGSIPGRGTTLRPGAAVDLIVSLGPRPVKVGDWIGEDIDDVRAAYDERGLVVNVVSEEYDDDVPAGGVLTQDPRGSTLFHGDAVAFTVSKGPELVQVPTVRAFGVSAATDELESLGFEVEVEALIGNPLGFVLDSDPEAGSMAPKGSTITLYVT